MADWPDQPLMSLNPSSFAPRRRQRVWWIALVIFLVVAFFAAKPGYRRLKAWRAHRLVAQAEQAITREDYQQAVRLSEVALQLAPTDQQAMRLMARLLTLGKNANAMLFWNVLLAGPEATAADQTEMLRAAVAFKRLDILEKHLTGALAQAPVATETLRLAAWFSEARGQREPAIRYAMEALQRDNADGAMLLLLGRLLITAADPAQRRQAKEIAWGLADKPDQTGFDALILLANHADQLTPAEERRCLEKLSAHPTRGPEQRFVLANLRLRIEPDRRRAIIDQAIQATPAGDKEQKLLLARWLLVQREYARVLEVLPKELALSSMELAIPYLDGLAQLNRWGEIKNLLEKEKLPLDPALVALYRMRVAREENNLPLANTFWDQAQNLAAEKPGVLWEIARYAETLDETAQVERAYRRLTRHEPAARAAYMALIRRISDERNTAKLRDLMQEISRRYPGEKEPANDLAYLNLLLGQNVAAATTQARELVAQEPGFLAFRATLALAGLRNHDPGTARLAFDGVNIDWSTVQPGWRAVHAAALGATGSPDEARELASGIPLAQLKPEERLLVQPWLQARGK